MEFTASVYAPILAPIGAKDARTLRRRADAAVYEISSLTGQIHATAYVGRTLPLEIAELHSAEESPEFAELWRESASLRAQRFLRFTARQEVELDEYRKHLEEQNPHFPPEDLPDSEVLARDVVTSDVSLAVADLALAAAIATAGAFEIHGRFGFCNGHFIRTESGLSSSSAWAADRTAELGWPPLLDLQVKTVWDWLRKLPGFDDGAPRGPAGRAVSALSYIFGGAPAQSPVVDLVWALVGLEALYGIGTTGLKRQLMDKSEIVLGPRTAFKKRFDRIYDFRSRFVHGDIDFPLEYRSDEEFPGLERFEDESVDTMLLAQVILIATVQKLVELNQYELKFRYTLETS
jgi:hypothetical protein